MEETPETTALVVISSDRYISTNLQEIIERMFLIAHSAIDSDDFVSTSEVLEAVNKQCPCDNETIYETMRDMGFKSQFIEGDLYWLVKNIC